MLLPLVPPLVILPYPMMAPVLISLSASLAPLVSLSDAHLGARDDSPAPSGDGRTAGWGSRAQRGPRGRRRGRHWRRQRRRLAGVRWSGGPLALRRGRRPRGRHRQVKGPSALPAESSASPAPARGGGLGVGSGVREAGALAAPLVPVLGRCCLSMVLGLRPLTGPLTIDSILPLLSVLPWTVRALLRHFSGQLLPQTRPSSRVVPPRRPRTRCFTKGGLGRTRERASEHGPAVDGPY